MTRPTPIIAGTLVGLLLLFGAYMGTYYLPSIRLSTAKNETVCAFQTELEAALFSPAAKIEGLCLRRSVFTCGPHGDLR
jgi:hypothetical protein